MDKKMTKKEIIDFLIAHKQELYKKYGVQITSILEVPYGSRRNNN